MPKIFVNTDNSNAMSKIYKATKVGKSAAAVEKKMQEEVVAALGKTADFTTDKSESSKGYTIRIEVIKVETVGPKTTYTFRSSIVRYPSTAGQGGKGEEMVSTTSKDPTITVQGASEAMLLDGVESVTENIVNKSLGGMRVDMARR